MNAVSPVLPGFNVPEVEIAKDQKQYQTLPAVMTKDGLVLSRWELTKEERQGLISGVASLFVFVWLGVCHKCGIEQHLSPLLPEIATPQQIMTRAARQVQKPISENGHPIEKAETRAAGAEPGLLDQLSEITASDQAEVSAEAPSDAEIKVLFFEMWNSHIGRPGYRERRWREFRELLIRRGIMV